MTISIKHLYIFIGFSLVVSACNPARKVIKQPLKEIGSDFVFDKLKKSELQFNDLSAKFNASLTIDKKKTSTGGQVRIKSDSVIWVSLTPALGLEAARILITLDSVKFLNRINSKYLKSDFSFINDYLNSGFDFDMLQALIIGNDLRYYENDQFKAGVDGMHYNLSTIGRHKLKKFVRNSTENLKVLVQNIDINPENGKITHVFIKELNRENKKLEAEYSDFLLVNNQLFPQHVEFRISAEKEIRISIDFSRIRINEGINLPFSIPEKYESLR
jgi:hypothetical protein